MTEEKLVGMHPTCSGNTIRLISLWATTRCALLIRPGGQDEPQTGANDPIYALFGYDDPYSVGGSLSPQYSNEEEAYEDWNQKYQFGDLGYSPGYSVTEMKKIWEATGQGERYKVTRKVTTRYPGTRTSVNDFVASSGMDRRFAGIELEKANDVLTGVDYASGVVGVVQIGMLDYRQSLSIQSKIGTFPRFNTAYRVLGTTGRTLGGAATYVGVPLTVGLDYNAMKQGQISTQRFAYRTSGVAASVIGGIAVGAAYGGPWGAAAGAAIGLGTSAGEIVYDGVNWLWNETSRQIYDFENALKSGWYPGK